MVEPIEWIGKVEVEAAAAEFVLADEVALEQFQEVSFCLFHSSLILKTWFSCLPLSAWNPKKMPFSFMLQPKH